MAKKSPIGSSFDDFLRDEGIYDEVKAETAKRVLAMQVADALAAQGVTRSELAARMHTSRTVVNRLLDPTNPAINLKTVQRAASALGKRMSVQLIDE